MTSIACLASREIRTERRHHFLGFGPSAPGVGESSAISATAGREQQREDAADCEPPRARLSRQRSARDDASRFFRGKHVHGVDAERQRAVINAHATNTIGFSKNPNETRGPIDQPLFSGVIIDV